MTILEAVSSGAAEVYCITLTGFCYYITIFGYAKNRNTFLLNTVQFNRVPTIKHYSLQNNHAVKPLKKWQYIISIYHFSEKNVHRLRKWLSVVYEGAANCYDMLSLTFDCNLQTYRCIREIKTDLISPKTPWSRSHGK